MSTGKIDACFGGVTRASVALNLQFLWRSPGYRDSNFAVTNIGLMVFQNSAPHRLAMGHNSYVASKEKTMRISTQTDREKGTADSFVNRENSVPSAGIHLQALRGSLPSHEIPDQLLEAWKDIAAYMRRDVRTVQRWEKSLDLPIYRLQDSRSGPVFAYKKELDAWWQKRAVQVAPNQANISRPDQPPEAKASEQMKTRISFPWTVALISALFGAVAGTLILFGLRLIS